MRILKSVFLIFGVLFFFSCQKEEIEPKPDNNNFNDNTSVDIQTLLFDKDWVLVSGNFYYQNPKIYFNHPNNSFLNPFYGPDCNFDNFDIGVTTWKFNSTQFYLNNVLQSSEPILSGVNQKFIKLFIDNGGNEVIRDIEVLNITESRLEIKTNSIGSLIGNPYSILVFRSTPTITNPSPHVPFGYTHQGVLNTSNDNPNISSSDLVGSTWVVTKFYNGFGYDQPNDTIVFLANDLYTVNGGSHSGRTYNINTIVGNTSVNLNLNDFITMGGNNYSILTSRNFITDGVINGSQVTDILNPNNSNKFIWMVKIQ